MNLTELRNRVRSLSNIYSSSVLPDATIDVAVNDAIAMVCALEVWPPMVRSFTVEVSAGVSSYTLPTSSGVPRDMLSVSNRQVGGTNRDLHKASLFSTEAFTSSSRSVPMFYTAALEQSSPTLTLYPSPIVNEVLTVLVRVRPPKLVAGSDVPPFLDEFHPVFAYMASAVLLSERRGDERKVESLKDLATQQLETMRRHYLVSHDAKRVNIGSRRYRRTR